MMGCTWYVNAAPSCTGVAAGASANITTGHALVVDACASSGGMPLRWEGPVAACGDAGFWAATDAAGEHLVPDGAAALVVEGAVPPMLSASRVPASGRSTFGSAVTAAICSPATTPATYVANLAPPALQLSLLTLGRAATITSAAVSDAMVAAAYGGNATLLYRASGVSSTAPAQVTVFWGDPAPFTPPSLAQLIPAIATQARWSTSTTQRAWMMTFTDASGASVSAAASAVTTLIRAVNASLLLGQTSSVTYAPPPPAPLPLSAADVMATQVLPFVSIVTASCIFIGTVIGILTYRSREKIEHVPMSATTHNNHSTVQLKMI